MAFPTAPEQVSARWLTEALHAGGFPAAPPVASLSHQEIGTGQVGRCARLEIRYTEDPEDRAPASLVAKFPSSDPTSLAAARAQSCYVFEVGFYRELRATVDPPTPRCLFADIDEDGGQFALLLEDARPAVQGDQIAGCTPEQALVAVAALAGLHAPRWGDGSLAAVSWLEGQAPARAREVEALYRQVVPGFCARFAGRLESAVLELAEGLAPVLARVMLRPAHAPTLIHRDFRADNLLFAPGTGSVWVVDWQTIGRGPAAHDLAYFIGGSLPVEERRRVEERLMAHYLGALRYRGVAVDEEAVRDEYRYCSYGGLVMAVIASMIVGQSERGDAMFATMAERHARHALELDAPAAWFGAA